jgi:hypothetical protein
LCCFCRCFFSLSLSRRLAAAGSSAACAPMMGGLEEERVFWVVGVETLDFRALPCVL